MRSFLQDLRYGLRLLARQPGFAIVATLVLGLGIGANTTMFSLVDALALKPRLGDTERMVNVFSKNRVEAGRFRGFSFPNYLDLRAELAARGHVFRTHSDTEVLVHGYEEYGRDLPSRLRGMFAFAIYDRRGRKLLLARDHFGQKPLYYFAGVGRFAFGSELKSLLALDWVPREADPEALLDYVSTQQGHRLAPTVRQAVASR